MVESTLEVDFCGEVHRVDPDDGLLFGRSADLVIDDANPYLHRTVGRFRQEAGVWWIDNLGSAIELFITTSSGSRFRLPPARGTSVSSAAIVDPQVSVEFRADITSYLLEVSLSGRAPVLHTEDLLDGDHTVGPGRIQLVPDERLLLAALSEPRLRNPLSGPTALPSNREVAARFGWPLTTYNRKLDRLCDRFRKAGVPGMQGVRGAEAANRRWILVEHAVNSGLVSLADLAPTD